MTEEAWMTFMPDGTDDDVWYTNPEGKLPEGYTYQKLNPNWSKEMAQPEQEPVLWMMPDGKTADKWALQFYRGQKGTPLYTTPPQRMAKRIEELEEMLERQTARIVDLQTHIQNIEGEE